MILAVASGKGGTGKTTVALSLASVAKNRIIYVDCDVEEPNAHLFLNPRIDRSDEICIPVPFVDETRCTHCGKCASICRYGAIASLPAMTLVFEELCHGCGGCTIACPVSAITEKQHRIGVVESGSSDVLERVTLVQGRIDVGVPLSPPLIRAAKKAADDEKNVLLDCPPGTSCPMIASVRGADYVALVTEPTPFGLHDLSLAVETLRELALPFGVIINRSCERDGIIEAFCDATGTAILGRIPDDRRVAEAYSRGVIPTAESPLMRRVCERVAESAAERASEKGVRR